MPVPPPPRLMVDRTLGNVGRDLRLLGYDTAVSEQRTDAAVLRVCQAQSRILATRNRRLHRRAAGVRSIYVQSREADQQTLEVLKMLASHPTPARCLTRCLSCNGILRERPASAIHQRVPDHLLTARDVFAECTACRRVYWEGTHTARLRSRCLSLQYALQSALHRV